MPSPSPVLSPRPPLALPHKPRAPFPTAAAAASSPPPPAPPSPPPRAAPRSQAVAQSAIVAAVGAAAVGGLLGLLFSHCIVEVNARRLDD